MQFYLMQYRLKNGYLYGYFQFYYCRSSNYSRTFGSSILKLFDEKPIAMIVVAGVSMILAAVCVFVVKEVKVKPELELADI